ncbi:hypothetical protein BGZ65_007281 [Modicella reniformis]|uniref:DUF1754-domain-containing protein n=1 Tax=Modicella reniformis TaxID=1440133 RepID=A0A9P6JMM4_9FUNG|nr:hypothetical protein BGZ65_007281 [Modicella reniformis]
MDYESTGGSLKFKDGGGVTKKKKKKTNPSKVRAALEEAKESTPPPSKTIKVIEKTAAERMFEEVQRKRVLKAAMKSHKEKVAELNKKLEELTEHYDIPKVGPG